MSRYEFRLPDIGEGTAEAECVGWHVKVGDAVEEDQPLIDVMTDKATVEVTSPVDGKVVELRGAPGEMMQVGSVVIVLETSGGIEVELPANTAQSVPRPQPPSSTASSPIVAPSPALPVRVLSTPAVRKRARDLGIDLAHVPGTGPQGRVRGVDLNAFIAHSARAPAPASEPAQTAASAPPPRTVLPSLVTGTEEFDEVPVIGLRRKIAERMQDTKRRIPHFSYVEEVDVTALEQMRTSLNRKFEGKRAKLTLLPFLIRALAETLPDFPHLNALFDDSAGVVRYYRAFQAGIATQTPKGLVVTVLRDAQDKDLWTIAEELSRLSELARSGRAAAGDLSGSTLTITSLGAMGGIATTPVINSPEVAIVGVNKVVERPVVTRGSIGIAKMMNLSSSFDHRVVDGWDAASFIQQIRALLEEPSLLLVG